MIKPINDYIVLKVDETKRKIKDIILIENNEKKKSNVGVVVAVSSFSNKDISINIGDKIIYRDYAVTEYIDNGEKFLLVQLEDVLAVIL